MYQAGAVDLQEAVEAAPLAEAVEAVEAELQPAADRLLLQSRP